MRASDFLFQAADALARGDLLDPEGTGQQVEAFQVHLEEICEQGEQNPSPEGLEALDEALVEAANLFSEAADLLMLAVNEDIPELATIIKERTQDAVDTLRALRQNAEQQTTMLTEEMPVSE